MNPKLNFESIVQNKRCFLLRIYKKAYKAATREEAERQLLQLGETWNGHYAMAVRSWENNWADLAVFKD